MNYARGQNKLFQNASLLMCSFATGQFLSLKTLSVIHAIAMLFKFQIRLYRPTSTTN